MLMLWRRLKSLYLNKVYMISITFPDNSVKEFEAGVTPLQIAESISGRLAREVLAATVDGKEWDLTCPITADAAVKLFKWEDPEGNTLSGTARHIFLPKHCRFYTQV